MYRGNCRLIHRGLKLQSPGLVHLEQRHARCGHRSWISHPRRHHACEGRNQTRITHHRARPALLCSRRIGLRTHCLKICRRCLGAPRHFVHLLRTYALLGLKLLVTVQRARRQSGVRLRRSLHVERSLHARLCLLHLCAQCRIVENHQRLSGPNVVSLANQHLLDTAYHLSRYHRGFPGMNSARRSQAHRNLLLLAFNNPRLHGLCGS